MAAIAAHTRKVYVKTSSSAPSGGDEVDGIKDASFTRERTSLDTTNYKGSENRTRMLGLKDVNGNLGGDLLLSDSVQGILRSAHESGDTVYVTDLPDGTNGYTYPVLVESIEESGGVDDLISATFNIVGNGAKIARP